MMAQADYQRTNGTTTVQKFIAGYEPQARLGDRAFAFGLGRWERDKMQGFGARWSASGGFGYKDVDTRALTLNLKAGPAWPHTRSAERRVGTECVHKCRSRRAQCH